MKRLQSGGGWPAIAYSWRMARQAGGLLKLLKALRRRNACKTCALGMGGQLGGMVDESGRFPEVCKKSIQAMAADMRGRIAHEFWMSNGFGRLQRFSSLELERLGRLVEPLHAGPQDSGYRPVSWDEAMGRCVDLLKGTDPGRSFFYVSGRSSNEAGFLLQLFARLYGTNHVNNCSFYCHQASGVGLTSSLGTGTATVALSDLDECDLMVLIGANPASNHPRLMRQLVKLRRRGGEVLVINPLVELGLVRFRVPSDIRSLLFGSTIAGLYLQPHAGGDLALLTALAKRVEELGGTDDRFVEGCTTGASAYREFLSGTDWAGLISGSGVNRDGIDRAARVLLGSRRTIFAWTMGITHHRHGVENVRAIVNLALLRGMVGKRGAGLLPIRGHSNVQGIGSVGVVPLMKPDMVERLTHRLGVPLASDPGWDTMTCLEAAHDGRLDLGVCLGGNLFGASPDAARVGETLRRLRAVIYLSTSMNTGHVHGRGQETIVLPVRTRDEESQATTQESMFNFVRMSDGGPQRYPGPRSESEIINELGRRVVGDRGQVSWKSLSEHRHIREIIAAVVPGYGAMAAIDPSGREFQVEGRTLHHPRFSTPDGRASFHVPSKWPPDGQETEPDELRLMTIRSEGQFNTVVYEDEDLYRGVERRDVILMNLEDLKSRGLAPGQPVTVRSRVGAMHRIRVQPAEIRAGNAAMYYPEANQLVPGEIDPQSRTPAFKNVRVTVVAEQLPPTDFKTTRHHDASDRNPALPVTQAPTSRGQLRAC